jgi:hypothetical protein
MSDARGSARLVGGADPVPHHMCHHRRAVVRDDNDLQAVGELELGNARSGLRSVDGDGHCDRCQAKAREKKMRLEIGRTEQLIQHRHHHPICGSGSDGTYFSPPA